MLIYDARKVFLSDGLGFAAASNSLAVCILHIGNTFLQFPLTNGLDPLLVMSGMLVPLLSRKMSEYSSTIFTPYMHHYAQRWWQSLSLPLSLSMSQKHKKPNLCIHVIHKIGELLHIETLVIKGIKPSNKAKVFAQDTYFGRVPSLSLVRRFPLPSQALASVRGLSLCPP